MEKKPRKKFSKEQRQWAVDSYLSGEMSAKEVARKLETEVQTIYRWKVLREERAKGARIDDLIDQGNSREQANRILDLELELEEYKKKLAEQVVINDLLKKLQPSAASAPESELTGLLRTSRLLDQFKKRVK